jgi:hypothetical protein
MITINKRAEQLQRLRVAVETAIDDHYDLSEIAAFLRYQQLCQNVLHPDDCCNWSADGTDPRMKQLAEVLAEQGILDLVDARARRLMAQVQFARTTTKEIQKAEGTWGSALAALDNWTDVANTKTDSTNG